MGYAYGKVSIRRTQGLHPHLIECLFRSIEDCKVDNAVICGVRSYEEQISLYAQGRTTAEMIAAGVYDFPGKPKMPVVTWTLNSNHFVRASGFGHAVDLAPYVNGRIEWENGVKRKDWKYFPLIAESMLATAKQMNIPLTWGGDWKKPDGPHFELPKDYKG